MIAFCAKCWAEMNAAVKLCPNCGAEPETDARSYHAKLIAALAPPLPAVRVRVCWLIGKNNVREAVHQMMQMAERDADLFVRKAALEALAELKDARAASLLETIRHGSNRFLAKVLTK